MAQKPIAMEQIKQILQLWADGVGIREMARRVGISRNTVRKYLESIKKADPVNLENERTDQTLAGIAYNNDSLAHDMERLKQLTIHLQYAREELKKTGVTRQILWKEYIQQHPDGYAYSHYCHHFKQLLKNQDLAMHLEYKAADTLMIDFAGKKLNYIEPLTGEIIDCQIFVSILPFSGLIFCHAVHSQQTGDFTSCIKEMLLFYSGAPATILCDNLKTAVIRPDRYEPIFTDVCLQLSEHYSTTFSATRSYSPRDKAMVERAVNIVYVNIYAPLRNLQFTSLVALNRAIKERLTLLNEKPYKNTPYSRRYLFEGQERHLLKPLPGTPYSPKKVVILTVQRNYHIQLSEDRRYYSVPYKFVGKKVKVLYDQKTLEIYLDLERIALHKRTTGGSYITLKEHMPPNHSRMQQIKGFNKDDLLAQAQRIGEATHQVASVILQNSIYMEQNYKSCFGMLMLHKKYGNLRLNAACTRALLSPRINYTMVKNILEKGLDKQQDAEPAPPIPLHDNIRGADYYQ